MLYSRIVGFLLIPILFTATPTHLVDAIVKPDTRSDKEIAYSLAQRFSKEYNVSFQELWRTMSCENDTYDPKRQSELKYKSGNRWGKIVGSYEESYGLAMIHLPDHPEITYEQATNAEFSVHYMAEQFSLGRAWMWSCY